MHHNWPALLDGCLMAAYWGQVMYMAARARRSGGSANVLPRERLGRVLRIIWFPVVTLWIALPLLAFFARSHAGRSQSLVGRLIFPWPMPLAAQISALVIAVAALILTMICWRKMGSSWRMGIDPADKTQLVVSGPYAYVRHPIYALSSILMLATAIIVPGILMLIVAFVHLLLLQWEARREEKYLVSVHGAAYQAYAAVTGRFCPKFDKLG